MNKVKIKKIIAERLILFLNMCENQQATYGFQPKWKAITPLVKHTQELYDKIPSKSKNCSLLVTPKKLENSYR